MVSLEQFIYKTRIIPWACVGQHSKCNSVSTQWSASGNLGFSHTSATAPWETSGENIIHISRVFFTPFHLGRNKFQGKFCQLTKDMSPANLLLSNMLILMFYWFLKQVKILNLKYPVQRIWVPYTTLQCIVPEQLGRCLDPQHFYPNLTNLIEYASVSCYQWTGIWYYHRLYFLSTRVTFLVNDPATKQTPQSWIAVQSHHENKQTHKFVPVFLVSFLASNSGTTNLHLNSHHRTSDPTPASADKPTHLTPSLSSVQAIDKLEGSNVSHLGGGITKSWLALFRFSRLIFDFFLLLPSTKVARPLQRILLEVKFTIIHNMMPRWTFRDPTCHTYNLFRSINYHSAWKSER